MSNLINQQVAFDLFMSRAQELAGITGDLGGACVGAAKLIKKLPSAEPKRGEWIKWSAENGINIGSQCSMCGYITYATPDYGTKFCPNCGAKMFGEDGE